MKIILSTVAALFLFGCSEGTTESVKETAVTQTNSVVEKSKEVATDVKKLAIDSTQNVKKVAKETATQVQTQSAKIVDESTTAVKQTVEKVKVKSAEVVKDTKSSVDATRSDIAKAIEPAKKEPAIDGATLYKACAACHGVNAEKKALNKSQIIQGWETSKIVAALNGYKDGTYGSTMKGVMKPQVSKLSDAEIEAVAKYISGL